MNGTAIRFSANGIEYTGRVEGDSMQGTAKGRGGERPWRATRAQN